MVVVVEEKDNSNSRWWKILMVIDLWGNRDKGKENRVVNQKYWGRLPYRGT